MPICLECGKSFRLLNSHITRTHKISTTEYRQRHGDDVKFSDDSVKELQRQNGFSPWSVPSLLKRGMSMEDATSFLEQKRQETFGSHTSVRSVDYWMKHGMSMEDAKLRVKEVQSRGEQFFIGKYGDDGVRCHSEYRGKIGTSNTKEHHLACGYTEDEIRMMRNNTSIEALVRKCGYDIDTATKIHSDRLSKFVSYFSIDYWVSRGHDIDTAKRMNHIVQKRDIAYFVSKYGDAGIDRYVSFIHKATKHSVGKYASKESCIYFSDLVSYCEEHGISYEKEKYMSVSGKSYYVDFVIESMKLAFEYDGEAFHADSRIVDHDWVSAKGKVSYSDSIAYDFKKRTDIESCGYTVINIHSKYKNEYNLVEIVESKLNGTL